MRRRLFFVILAFFAAATTVAAAQALPRPAPVVADGSAWQRRGDAWTLRRGRPGDLDAAAWWTGDRPPRGSMVVLAFDYRDDVTQPVRAAVYSGLGILHPYTELARFGGLADGRWKTARVPVDADETFRYLPAQALRLRLTSPGGDLALRDFRLVAPAPDEEARYAAETRAWVARVQARATVDPGYWALAERPDLPPAWAARPLVPFARNWMIPVRPISAPQKGEAGRPLRTRLLLGEAQPVQLGVYANGRALSHVRVRVDPLVDAAGRAVARIGVRVAENAKVRGRLIPNYLIEPFPQRLWPAFPFDVAAGRSRLVRLTVHTDGAAARPGRYRTVVHLSADGVEPLSLPLEVTVVGARLLSMDQAGLKFGAAMRDLPPESALASLRGYNLNMANLWYFSVRPRLGRSGASFAMDFRVMDAWMAAARRQGFDDVVYFLGGDPYGFPRTMHLPRTLAAAVLGLDDAGWAALVDAVPARVPPTVAPLIVDWSRRFAAHARAHDWPRLLLTPFDEPAKFHQYRSGRGMLTYVKPQFEEQVRLLRQGDPGLRIYASIHDAEVGLQFLGDVDVFCTNVYDDDPSMAAKVKAAGKTFWEYAGADDRTPAARARYTFGFRFAAHGSRGALVWAYDWGDGFDTLDGRNWMEAWQTPFGLVPSIALEALREAWDDRRLIATVQRAAAAKGVNLKPFLAGLDDEVAAARPLLGARRTADFGPDATAAARRLDGWRDRLIDKLIELRAP